MYICVCICVYIYIHIYIYIFLYDIGLYYILYIILSYRWYDISVETNHWLRDHFGEPPNFVRSPNWIYNSSPKKPVTTSSVILQGLSPHLEEEVLLKLLLKKSVHGSSVHHMHTLAVKKKNSCLGDPKNADSQSQTWRFAVRLARWLSHYPFLYMHYASFWYTISIYIYTIYIYIYIYVSEYIYIYVYLPIYTQFFGWDLRFSRFFTKFSLGSTATVGRP